MRLFDRVGEAIVTKLTQRGNDRLIFLKLVLSLHPEIMNSVYSFRNLSRRGVRVVEGARLESVYTPKVYPGFESQSLR